MGVRFGSKFVHAKLEAKSEEALLIMDQMRQVRLRGGGSEPLKVDGVPRQQVTSLTSSIPIVDA